MVQSPRIDTFTVTDAAEDVLTRPLTNAEHQAQWRQRHPDVAKERKTKHRHDNSKWQTNAHYLSRTIVAWDGEGVTLPSGDHIFVMFAAKASDDSVYRSIVEPTGIGTAQLFEFILNLNAERPGALNVIYGGGYDFNMIMRDIPRDDLYMIYHRIFHVWQGYRISWRRGKSLYVKRINGDLPGVTIFDTVSFFQQSFVDACDSYLGERFVDRDLIVRNKALRSSFTMADVPEVSLYNSAELTNLLLLIAELRERMNKVGLRPRRWDGPGAVAAALLMREKAKDAMTVCSAPVAEAARYAYAGGRFEVVRFGHVERPAYEYDVNSAYPSALRNVPNLARGVWEHLKENVYLREFALYHVSFKTNGDMTIPGPLFYRDAKGHICYPMSSTGWYWGPEVDTLREYCAKGYGSYEILESWQYVEDDPTDRPFAFIEPLYLKRQALKKAHDGAHIGLKLALNSLYGKLAQQVGWKVTDKGLRVPPFHQLEWAGYTTSWCRAAVLRAALMNMNAVIAFETDAVFMSEPIDLPVSNRLGEFECTEFVNLTYVQSGTYFGDKVTSEGTTLVERTRGVDRRTNHDNCTHDQTEERIEECSERRGEMTRKRVLDAMVLRYADDRDVETRLTRFNGLGIALMQGMDKWRKWETITKRISVEPVGKRCHYGCDADTDVSPIALGEWHETMCPLLSTRHSHEFPVEWVNPNPEMSGLDEMRREEKDYE